MKALILKEYNRLVYEDAADPVIGRDEVLIRVAACGICGSDVHGMDGSTGRRIPPLIMGHEAAGVIQEVGAEVRDWKSGDRVTFDSTLYCGACRYCRMGKINLCDNRNVLGVSCDEYRRHGAFADFVAVPQRILYRLPDELAFERAATVEALSIARHAVRRAEVESRETALVVGAGTIGLLIVQMLRASGYRHIAAVDVNEERLLMARKMGATTALSPERTDVTSAVLELTEGVGVDAAFEVVGLAETFRTAVHALQKGGTLCLVGNLSPSVELPLQVAVTRELSIHGSCASCGEYPDCLDMLARGVVDVDSMISAVAPLSEGAMWFERLRNQEPGLMKVILKP